MVIINPTHNTPPAAFSRPAGPAPVMPLNRVLNAVVLGERAQHLYELASGSLRMMAESQTALREGEQLQLRVLGHDRQQRPQLEILQRQQPDITPQLRNRLPEQRSLNHLAASLDLIRLSDNRRLQQWVAPLLAQLPQRQQLSSPTGLRSALLHSGQFLEAQLARGDIPKNDVKLALLSLLATLSQHSPPPPKAPLARSYAPVATPSNLPAAAPESAGPAQATSPYPATENASRLPGQLHAQGRLSYTPTNNNHIVLQQLSDAVKGALARHDANQLLALQQREHGGGQLLELPVRDRDGIDIWQLQFQPPRGNTPTEQKAPRAAPAAAAAGWALSLSFDLPGLGAILARLRFTEQQLSVQFDAEQARGLALLTAHSSALQKRIEDRGIAVSTIDCQRSRPQNTPPDDTLNSLLRDEA